MIRVGDVIKFSDYSKAHHEWATDEYYTVIHIHKHTNDGCILILDKKFPLDGRPLQFTKISNVVHSAHVEVCTKEVRNKKLKEIFNDK